DHPVFYGFADSILAIGNVANARALTVGVADRDRILAGYVRADTATTAGAANPGAADAVARNRERAFAVDVTAAHNGRGRVLLFADDPIDAQQNPAGLGMMFNALLNWDDVPRTARRVVIAERERPAMLPCPWP